MTAPPPPSSSSASAPPPPPRRDSSSDAPSQLRFRGARDAATAEKDGVARRVEVSARGPSVLQRVIARTGGESPQTPSRELNLAAFATATDAAAAEALQNQPTVVWHDADYCLYVELARGAEDDVAHGMVDAVAALLRDVGCHVRVFPLQQLDTEIPAAGRDETQAYVITVCSAFMTASPTKERMKSAHSKSFGSEMAAVAATVTTSATALWAQALPAWITQHTAFKLVCPLSGAARSQQLTRLILKEFRLPRDVRLEDGTLVFTANRRLIRELMRHDDALRIQVFPLHRDSERDRLIGMWKNMETYRLPLLEVFQYFGPKLGMYFAWLEFYTEMLRVPAVVGVLVSVLGHFNAQSYVFLSFAVSICTSVFVDCWRRRQREVEYKWKYQQLMESDAVVDLETRPQFRGEWMADPVSGQQVYDFPDHKRLRRQLLAIPLILGMCALVGAYVVALNVLSEHLRGVFPACYVKNQHPDLLEKQGLSSAACLSISQGPGVLNAVIIQLMDSLYQRLARALNEYENYRTNAEFEEHLVLKRMPFHFVNSNASLWFLAFYVRDLDRVRDRLWILMVLMQVLDNFKEVGLPFLKSVLAKAFTTEGKRRPSTFLAHHPLLSLSGFSDDLRTLTDRLQRVLTQKRQAHYVDTFSDYKEMMVQYGYVALYTPIFPLAPFFAWANNLVESRSDFFKLVNSNGFQRPLVRHTHGIGVWENVLVSFSVVAVVINCALVWTYELQQLVPGWSELHRFMLLVACEHLVFVIKALLNWASPELPTWIQNEKRLASLTSTHAQLLSPRRKLLHHSHW